MVKFNPTVKTYKSIVGAVPKNKTFNITLKLDKNVGVNRVFFCFYKDGGILYRRFMPCVKQADFCTYKLKISFAEKGLYFYYFEAETNCGVKFVCASDSLDGVLCDRAESAYQLTVYETSSKNAYWFAGGVVYHIFVDRFCKDGVGGYPKNAKINADWYAIPDYRPVDGEVLNNEFFGGNISGILQKLKYIKSLGTTLIYLSPIFQSNSNHKYNTGDYLKIDEGFGNEEIFANFIQEANKLGIAVILDGVFSHTGDDSVYFNKYGNYDSCGAYQSKDSPYYGWYSFEEYPNKYKSWWGIDTLPEVEETNPSYIDFVCNKVVPKWFDMGVKGMRLDVADELPDGFLYPLCSAIKNCGDNVIIGEVWENATDKISYGVRRKYFQGGQLDSVMNYPLKDGIISLMNTGDGDAFVNLLKRQINNYPKHSLDKMFNLLSSHDTKRILTALSDVKVDGKDAQAAFRLDDEQLKKSKAKLKSAAVLQYTLYGVPCLFYGDEAGLQGFGDPFCRMCYPWGKEDKELVSFYKALGKLREDKLFAFAEVKNIKFKNGVLSYLRKDKKRWYHICVNTSGVLQKKPTKKGATTVFGEVEGILQPYGYSIAYFEQ